MRRILSENGAIASFVIFLHFYVATAFLPVRSNFGGCSSEIWQPLGMASENELDVSFSHIHLYVDDIEDLRVYKDLERELNQFQRSRALQDSESSLDSVAYSAGPGQKEKANYVSHGRDIVKQLLVGLDMRITAFRYPSATTTDCTRSVVIRSPDPRGVQFIVSAIDNTSKTIKPRSSLSYFDSERIARFFQSHNNRQGIAVLAFETNDVDVIYRNYLNTNKHLIVSYADHDSSTGCESKILEVCAYYSKGSKGKDEKIDEGTLLRFIQKNNANFGNCLPGLQESDAIFNECCSPVYCDHWVSNVHSRTGFLETLGETLGFSTKVDFNAGIVAAGDAQIESTVIGNSSPFASSDPKDVLKDQSQVYLPINNALSSAGHVYQFLEEYGQGIQHVASRVENLVEFVSKCNAVRDRTGEGFTFLDIPRSYYGSLSVDYLVDAAHIDSTLAELVVEACIRQQVVDLDSSVFLETAKDDVARKLELDMDAKLFSSGQYLEKKEEIIDAILKSRYHHLSSFLGERLSDETYLGIVRNKILVDIQGDDVLFQIFTNSILQRDENDEAPFLEFIQRVCSVNDLESMASAPQLKAGCGGFGIRNFLTLFLSIEMNKAIRAYTAATLDNDVGKRKIAQKQIDCLTQQMHDANPILQEIADAMAEEGRCKALLECCQEEDLRETYLARMEGASELKNQANMKLKECSLKYNVRMKSIRQESEELFANGRS